MLRAALLHECQNYLGGGGGLNVNASCSDFITVPLFFSPPSPPHPPPRAIIPDARPIGTFENQDTGDGKARYI